MVCTGPEDNHHPEDFPVTMGLQQKHTARYKRFVHLMKGRSSLSYEELKEIKYDSRMQFPLYTRAIENLAYVVTPAQEGQHDSGRKTYGHSLVGDPWGNIIACVEKGVGFCMAEVDFEAMEKTRQRFPALSHQRITIPEPVSAPS